MRLRAVLAALPEGYEVLRGQHGWLACERGSREVLLAAGFGPDGGEELALSELSGRRPLGSIESPGERWIVRRFHHGGLLRAFGENLYFQPGRPFHELALAGALRSGGFSTPRVVAARAVCSWPMGWRLALVSARVEGGIDGAVVLERLRRGELDARARQRLLETLGHLIGRLHAVGFLHADLHPRNLLLEPDLGAAWILDLDLGRFVAPLRRAARRDNLRRLYRAVRRREARGRPFLRRSDYLRFLSAYGRALGEEVDWRADWNAIQRRDRLHAPLHRLGWLLEAALGDGPERRDGAAAPQ